MRCSPAATRYACSTRWMHRCTAPGSERPAYLNPAAELQVGDVRDHAAVRRALDGVEAVFHEAAAVGVGQSMYEIERYVSVNTLGAAVLLEELVEHRAQLRRVVVASSMSIYGEGAYRNPRRRARLPEAAPDRAARGAPLGFRGRVGPPARAGSHARVEAAGADLRVRRHQARPRGALPVGRRGLRDSRPSRCATSTSTARASRSRTPTPA